MKALPLFGLWSFILYICSCWLVDAKPNILSSCHGLHGAYLAHPEDCARFLHCSHGRALLFTCPTNLQWNSRLNSCTWPDGRQCLKKRQNVKPLAKEKAKLKKCKSEKRRATISQAILSKNSTTSTDAVKASSDRLQIWRGEAFRDTSRSPRPLFSQQAGRLHINLQGPAKNTSATLANAPEIRDNNSNLLLSNVSGNSIAFTQNLDGLIAIKDNDSDEEEDAMSYEKASVLTNGNMRETNAITSHDSAKKTAKLSTHAEAMATAIAATTTTAFGGDPSDSLGPWAKASGHKESPKSGRDDLMPITSAESKAADATTNPLEYEEHSATIEELKELKIMETMDMGDSIPNGEEITSFAANEIKHETENANFETYEPISELFTTISNGYNANPFGFQGNGNDVTEISTVLSFENEISSKAQNDNTESPATKVTPSLGGTVIVINTEESIIKSDSTQAPSSWSSQKVRQEGEKDFTEVVTITEAMNTKRWIENDDVTKLPGLRSTLSSVDMEKQDVVVDLSETTTTWSTLEDISNKDDVEGDATMPSGLLSTISSINNKEQDVEGDLTEATLIWSTNEEQSDLWNIINRISIDGESVTHITKDTTTLWSTIDHMNTESHNDGANPTVIPFTGWNQEDRSDPTEAWNTIDGISITAQRDDGSSTDLPLSWSNFNDMSTELQAADTVTTVTLNGKDFSDILAIPNRRKISATTNDNEENAIPTKHATKDSFLANAQSSFDIVTATTDISLEARNDVQVDEMGMHLLSLYTKEANTQLTDDITEITTELEIQTEGNEIITNTVPPILITNPSAFSFTTEVATDAPDDNFSSWQISNEPKNGEIDVVPQFKETRQELDHNGNLQETDHYSKGSFLKSPSAGTVSEVIPFSVGNTVSMHSAQFTNSMQTSHGYGIPPTPEPFSSSPFVSYNEYIQATTIDPRLPFRAAQCQGHGNQLQFEASKCSQYYQCFAGWAFLLNCPEDFAFSATKGECEQDMDGICSN